MLLAKLHSSKLTHENPIGKLSNAFFWYLRGTTSLGILYSDTNLSMFIYSDADLACNTDDRKLRTGYCFLLGGGTFSWTSRKQGYVADFTTVS